MGKHNAPKTEGRGNPDQPTGRHHRADQQVATGGEQTWQVIRARLEAEHRLAARAAERRP